MGTASRGTKAAGGTDFSDNTDALASEVNTDFNNIYSEFNGSIDDDNVDAAADIDPGKIGDYSATAAEQQTATSPGDSESPTLATDLEEELEQLRYKIEENNLGIDVVRENAGGTTAASWTEPPGRGPNLLFNASGNIQDESLTNIFLGWETFGTVLAADNGSGPTGGGRAASMQLLTSADNSGLQQLVRGLKASTKYLVITEVDLQNAAQVIGLNTSGADATSGYRDISVTHTGDTVNTVLSGVIQTDASATNITLQLEAVSGHSGGTREFRFLRVGMYELGPDFLQELSSGEQIKDRITATQALTTGFVGVTGLSLGNFTVNPQAMLRVRCQISILFSGAGRAYARLSFFDNIGATGTISTDAFGVTGDTGDVQTIDLYHELVPDGDTVTGYTVQPEVIASGAVGTVNGVADTLTLASTLWVEQIFPG